MAERTDGKLDGDEPKRPQFGTRFLVDQGKIFEHNAWDNVEWDVTQEKEAEAMVRENSSKLLPQDVIDKYTGNASDYWDEFYSQHQNKFFKDRHWLFTEFPELLGGDQKYCNSARTVQRKAAAEEEMSQKVPRDSTEVPNQQSISESTNKDEGPFTDSKEHFRQLERETDPQSVMDKPSDNQEERTDTSPQTSEKGGIHKNEVIGEVDGGGKEKVVLWEIGCGVGNTVFPILQTNRSENLFIYCCDFSKEAVSLVQQNPQYDAQRCLAFVADISDVDTAYPIPENTVDVITLIFVLSAIRPEKMQAVVERLVRYLRPGGLLLFRDYGRYDLAQLRFKKGKCLGDSFYARGDGTLVYFFTEDEVHDLLSKAGLVKEQLHVDRRLQVNRGKQLKMYRVWVQCKYRKPFLCS